MCNHQHTPPRAQPLVPAVLQLAQRAQLPTRPQAAQRTRRSTRCLLAPHAPSITDPWDVLPQPHHTPRSTTTSHRTGTAEMEVAVAVVVAVAVRLGLHGLHRPWRHHQGPASRFEFTHGR